MKSTTRSLLHLLGFVSLLGVIWIVSLKLDIPWGQPGAVLHEYGHQLLLDIGIAITLAVSLNLILGIAGQFSLGHAGFVAAGAYMAAKISGTCFVPLLKMLMGSPLHLSVGVSFGVVMVVGMLAGMMVAAVLGLLVGLPTLRLRGDYLAIATLGFGEILAVFFQNFKLSDLSFIHHAWAQYDTPFFGGSTGLSLSSMWNEWIGNQPNPDAPMVVAVQGYLDNSTYFVGFFAVFAVSLLTIYVVHNIKYATSGRALLAIREDPVASESVGVPSTRYKVAAFVIGASLAGLAGGLVAHHKSLVNPESFRFMRSIEIVAMVILGGQGSITGSILAAIALTLLPEVLRTSIPPSIMSENTIEKWRMVIYSLFIILAMLFRPQGIFGRYELPDLFRWLFRRKSGKVLPQVSAGDLPVAVAGESGEPLLVAKELTMRFGGLTAVEDFSLTLMPGELVGLIGPNGAGKTTAFNMLTGVYRPTVGGISVRGRSIVGLKPHSISKRGVARTFQNIRLFGNLSVLDNVQIAQHAHHRQGIPSAIVRRPAFYREEALSEKNALAYLDIFHLAHLAGERANSLSYGDQRRLEIARALATRPKILLLDEPAAGMNPTEKRALMETIRELRSRFRLTILLIEHDMKLVMGVCERIIVLDYGKTIASGTPGEIRKNSAVITAYLGASAKQV